MSRLWVLVGVVVVLVGVGVVVLVNAAWMPWNDPRSCDLPGTVAAGPTSGASDVRLVEQGFSQSANGQLSVGAVVVNSGADIDYQTRISVQALDPTQRPVGSATVVEVPVLLPGQRIGVGQSIPTSIGTRIGSVQVVPESTHRLPAGALGGYQPVTATQPRTSHPNPLVTGTVDIHYTDTSTNCALLADDGAAVVYRDTRGSIVGGAQDFPGMLIVYRGPHGTTVGGEFHLPAGEPCEPGTRDMWVTPDGDQPADADSARTAIYQYCDLPAAKLS